MITKKPTRRDVDLWRHIYARNRDRLAPNRISGTELERYFVEKYAPQPFADADFIAMVEGNLLDNDVHREKLPAGAQPDVAAYRLPGEVLVGIDRTTGFFHVECADIPRAAAVWDDLFVRRGLDARDLCNLVTAAQYLLLTQGRPNA